MIAARKDTAAWAQKPEQAGPAAHSGKSTATKRPLSSESIAARQASAKSSQTGAFEAFDTSQRSTSKAHAQLDEAPADEATAKKAGCALTRGKGRRRTIKTCVDEIHHAMAAGTPPVAANDVDPTSAGFVRFLFGFCLIVVQLTMQTMQILLQGQPACNTPCCSNLSPRQKMTLCWGSCTSRRTMLPIRFDAL